MVEQFGTEASPIIREKMDQGHGFVLLATPETRIYVRMIVERMFATLPVLSHLEIGARRADQRAGRAVVSNRRPDIGRVHGNSFSRLREKVARRSRVG